MKDIAGPRYIGLLGIPLEAGGAVAGTLMGPAALRTAGLAARLTGLGHRVHDHGDVTPETVADHDLPAEIAARCRSAGTVAGFVRAAHERALSILEAGQMPVFMGGDHSISMGTASAVARHCAATGRDLVLLWLDAHADFNTPATSPSGNIHGMPVAMLCGDESLKPLLGKHRFPPLAPENVHLFGLRSIDQEERRAIALNGLDGIDMRLVDEFGVSVLLRRILADLDPARTHLHVSLDVDFLDPAVAPGAGTPVPGGATYREAHLVMEMLHDSGLVGSLDIVELNPFLDERGRSAVVLAELTASLFGRSVLDRPASQRGIARAAATFAETTS